MVAFTKTVQACSFASALDTPVCLGVDRSPNDPLVIGLLKKFMMDSSRQGALNNIESSIYRTAFKLRSVQTLCQLDLVDSSLIQQVLLRQGFRAAREGFLSVQQLLQVLQELFQRARVETPAQVHPRASDLTLSLLTAMYDSTERDFLKLLPVAAALIALSGDSPLTKYRALFQLYAKNTRGGYDSGARMTRRILRNLLTDLQQIPTVVGESHALCSVESAIRSCFEGVLSLGIKEEKFLSWAQSEPLILLWLPTCHRLSATEMATHPARCGVCRTFPITGLRYRCLKCLHFDICQVCFLSGLHSKSHQMSHHVVDHCIQVSAKENTKLLLRTLRNNLLQGRRWRKGAPRRPWLLGQANPKVAANPVRAKALLQCLRRGRKAERSSIDTDTPAVHSHLIGSPFSTAALNHQRMQDQLGPWEQPPQRPPDASVRDFLRLSTRTVEAHVIRLLKKQLNRCKDELQVMYASQEEKSGQLEKKIQELMSKQDGLWSTLQQMGQDLQALLQPPQPSPCCSYMVPKAGGSSVGKFSKGRTSSRIKNVPEEGPDWEPLSNPAVIDRGSRSQTNAGHVLPHSETAVQTSRAQLYPQTTLKMSSSLPSCQQGLPESPQMSPSETGSPALAAAEKKELVTTTEKQEEQDEEELQELAAKLMDAFSLEQPLGLQSSVNVDLYDRAERMCQTFSALVDQIVGPT
ncbi:dystrotelin [Ctenodactylus gundi]